MSEASDTAKIAELQQQLEKIRTNYNLLTNNQNELNLKYTAKIEECIQERLRSLEQWNQDEKAAAEKLHEGQLYAIENDVEKQIADSKKRVFEVILLKYHLLSEKLPKAAEYFRKFDNPFIEACSKEEMQRAKKIKVELPKDSNQPILSQEEIKTILEECQAAKQIASIVDGDLRVGDDIFTIGSTAVISTNDGISFTGAIRDIDGSNIYFVPNGGTELGFTLQAINIGSVKISK